MRAIGLCAGHETQWRKGRPFAPIRERLSPDGLCTIAGCGRKHKGQGLCAGHLWRKKQGKSMAALEVRNPGAACSQEGCSKPVLAKGMCERHWATLTPQGQEKTRRSMRVRRARLRGADVRVVLPRDLRRLWERQRGTCAHCPAPALHIDHVIPIARGGRDAIGNFQYLCRSCNLLKHARLEIELRLAACLEGSRSPMMEA